MKKRRIIMACIVLFIGVNIFLVAIDKDDKVARKSYITSWSETFKADMYEKMNKEGVLASVKERNVYFDKNIGSFQEFLVEEGAQVNVGDELYTYRAANYYETKMALEGEIDKIEGEIAAIELAISTISAYPIANINLLINDDEGNKIGETSLPSIESDYMKEQYVTEKEKELAQKVAQLESVQSQLTELETSGETITVTSPYAGKIATLSKDLNDPLITILDAQLHAIGELTEEERIKIEEGMAVEILINEKETTMQGSISEVSELPKAVDIEGPSLYPFHVAFAEEAEIDNLFPGLHTNLTITTKESLDATVAPDDAVFNNNLWKMTKEGKLSNQTVETGIYMNDMHEITKGASPGEWIAEAPNGQFHSGATFITPLKLDQVRWNKIFKSRDENWLKNLVTGLLSR